MIADGSPTKNKKNEWRRFSGLLFSPYQHVCSQGLAGDRRYQLKETADNKKDNRRLRQTTSPAWGGAPQPIIINGLEQVAEKLFYSILSQLPPAQTEELEEELHQFLAGAYHNGLLQANRPENTRHEEATAPGSTPLLPFLQPQPPPKQPPRLTWATEDDILAMEPQCGHMAHTQALHRLRSMLQRHLTTHYYNLEKIIALPEQDLNRHYSHAREFTQIATRAIDAIAVLEESRRMVISKKRLVWSTDYLISMDRVPIQFHDEIKANNKQMAEWAQSAPEATAPLPLTVLDTRHFSQEFKWRLLSSIENLDEAVDGILIKGDNLSALQLLQSRFANKVQCMYLDPPFNTSGTDYAYGDRYESLLWLTMMKNRLQAARPLLPANGTLYAHINHNEKERLRLLLDCWYQFQCEIIWRIGWVSGFKTRANRFIRNHETIYQYSGGAPPLFIKNYIPYPKGYQRRNSKTSSRTSTSTSTSAGRGYPLEDTWNCSNMDQLHSIRIMSFSKEKLGSENLTQKNENLLARMITSSSRPGDTVLDLFLGSGTTAAAAHKLQRKWIGIENGYQMEEYVVPRIKRVLAGEQHGIARDVGWRGGGMVAYMVLESLGDVMEATHIDFDDNNIPNKLDRIGGHRHPHGEAPGRSQVAEVEAAGIVGVAGDAGNVGERSLRYQLRLAQRESEPYYWPTSMELAPHLFRTITEAHQNLPVLHPDLFTSFNLLLGVQVTSVRFVPGQYLSFMGGVAAAGEKVLIIWHLGPLPTISVSNPTPHPTASPDSAAIQPSAPPQALTAIFVNWPAHEDQQHRPSVKQIISSHASPHSSSHTPINRSEDRTTLPQQGFKPYQANHLPPLKRIPDEFNGRL